MGAPFSGIKSAVFCGAGAFVSFWLVQLALAIFGAGWSSTVRDGLLMPLLAWPALVAVCIAVGYAVGLWCTSLFARTQKGTYSPRLPIWAAVLSLMSAIGILSASPSIIATGTFPLVFVACGCVATTVLRLGAPRWMTAS